MILVRRNMVLQNELVDDDDDLEHFDDIVEEGQNQISTSTKEPANPSGTVGIVKTIDTEGDSSEEEGVSRDSDSDRDVSEDEGDFQMGDGLVDVTQTEVTTNQSKKQPQASNKKLSLPGGYDPRHREPSYRYV